MKLLHALAAAWLLTIPMMAQKKEFTLDDLIPGGKTYWNLTPKHLFTAWWGDCLIETSADKVELIANEKGQKVYPKYLFGVREVNAVLRDGQNDTVRNLAYAEFPYPQQTLALLRTPQSNLLYDWQQAKVVWRQPRTPGASHHDFHAASRQEAYVSHHNLFVTTADGRVRQISTDGSRQLVYGQSVHRDEFGIHKGTFWSPSGRQLAFYRMDQSMVTDYPLVDVEARVAEYAPEKYPMAGMTSHKVTVGIYDVATQQTVYLQAGDPTDRYFTNLTWSPDEKTVFLIELPRTQDKAELVAYDAATGARKGVLYTETNAKYVHPTHPLTFLPWDADKFIYQSERDGYNHLYLFDVKKGEERQLTAGRFVVLDLLGFNPKTKSVIIKSTESSPIRNNHYAVDVRTGKRTPLDDGTGVHSATLSAGGLFLCDRWSAPGVPRKYDLVATAQKKVTNLSTSPDPWSDYAVPQIVGGTLKAADGTTDLYYRLIKPTRFEADKQYPAVVYVYGGPGLRNVEETQYFDARGWEIYMAQKGYVVFVLDNRGSCDRGFDFESCTYLRLGEEEMKDQLKGVEFLKSLPYVDSTRLGVHGWSFGGFMTTNLMCTYPDVFKVGVAGGPVIDWKFYEVMYGERYMRTPQANPEGYAATSLLNKAGNLKGRLQIIFGYNDPVCVPQHTLSFLRSCIEAGTQPDLFTYPGQGHNMAGHDRVHLHERITRYFEDYLKP